MKNTNTQQGSTDFLLTTVIEPIEAVLLLHEHAGIDSFNAVEDIREIIQKFRMEEL